MSFINTLLDPVLSPLLSLNPALSIFIISVIVSIIITLVYKLVTNQPEMKRLKDKLKDYQKRMRASRDKPDEMLKLQKESMSVNMEYMRHSFKPTLITFIPIILIFGWLQANLAYDPISVGDTFNVTLDFENSQGTVLAHAQSFDILSNPAKNISNNKAVFSFRAREQGTHYIDFEYESSLYSKKVLVTKQQQYTQQLKEIDNAPVKSISINYDKLTPLGSFSLFGWNPGWLALYIFFSLVSSILFRKLLKLY